MTDKMNKLKSLCKKHRILLVYLFGTQQDAGLHYLQGQKVVTEKTSDLDVGLLVESPPDSMYEFFGNLYLDLSRLFKPFNVDIVFLHEMDALFKFEIVCGRRIFASDERQADEYEENIQKIASDLSFKRKMFEKDFYESIENGYFEIELK
jgi:predicted nucleotidyltransferase